jgi:hypothetical protein
MLLNHPVHMFVISWITDWCSDERVRKVEIETNLYSLPSDSGSKKVFILSAFSSFLEDYSGKVQGCQTAGRDTRDTPVTILMCSLMANNLFAPVKDVSDNGTFTLLRLLHAGRSNRRGWRGCRVTVHRSRVRATGSKEPRQTEIHYRRRFRSSPGAVNKLKLKIFGQRAAQSVYG